MSRQRVLTASGRVLASGLDHLPHVELPGHHDQHDMVTVGSFVFSQDLPWLPVHAPEHPKAIYLCHRDVVKQPRREGYRGCCGPDGERKNVLDPDTGEPLAYEFADCWSTQYLRVVADDYRLEVEAPGPPTCLVGYIRHGGERLLLGAACGQDDAGGMRPPSAALPGTPEAGGKLWVIAGRVAEPGDPRQGCAKLPASAPR